MTALVKLKHLSRIRPSSVDKKTVEGEQSVRLCNYTDVYYNPLVTPKLDFMVASATAAQRRLFELRRGDILITKDSETADDIAVPAFVGEDLPGVLCGYHLSMIRPSEEVVRPRFLYWCMASQFVRSQAKNYAEGITRTGIRSELVASLLVPTPSLAAQRAVANYLDRETSRIDALVEKKQRLVRLLEARWQIVMSAGVSGELLGLDATTTVVPWLPRMPAEWRRAKLNLVARLGSGHTPSRQHPEWWEGPTIPWITTGEVSQVRDDRLEYLTETREAISELGLANSAAELHPSETVVLCRTASAGYSAIMGRDMATSQDFATWTCGPLLRSRYLLLCLRVMRQDLLGRLAMGSTHKTIYMPDIESITVPLPSVEVQDTLVDAVYSRLPAIDGAIDRLRTQTALLIEHRQALITAAVTGELDIPEVAA